MVFCFQSRTIRYQSNLTISTFNQAKILLALIYSYYDPYMRRPSTFRKLQQFADPNGPSLHFTWWRSTYGEYKCAKKCARKCVKNARDRRVLLYCHYCTNRRDHKVLWQTVSICLHVHAPHSTTQVYCRRSYKRDSCDYGY